MKIAVVGGALQGLEVVYLAQKAGIETRLFDRRARVPASALCGAFRQVDVLEPGVLDREMKGVDLIFPALESRKALSALHRWAAQKGMPIVHDPAAYRVSASKIESDAFFRTVGVPVPEPWPGCDFPVIAKPSGGSGSQGVRVFSTEPEMRAAIGDDPATDGWMVQSFVPGPTYSVEVIRLRGTSKAFPVTDLYMDAGYDCKRVTAPSGLPAPAQTALQALSMALADALALEGIMDVEAVRNGDTFQVLEIDARFPSQTPIAVFASSGVNLVETLIRGVLERKEAPISASMNSTRGVVLEHIRVSAGSLTVTGEHAVAGAAGLVLEIDFFGADEAITDYHPGKSDWVATLICTGADVPEAWARRDAVVTEISGRLSLTRYADAEPETIPKGAPP